MESNGSRQTNMSVVRRWLHLPVFGSISFGAVTPTQIWAFGVLQSRNSRRLVPWLLVIGVWCFLGLELQSKWSSTDTRGDVRNDKISKTLEPSPRLQDIIDSKSKSPDRLASGADFVLTDGKEAGIQRAGAFGEKQGSLDSQRKPTQSRKSDRQIEERTQRNSPRNVVGPFDDLDGIFYEMEGKGIKRFTCKTESLFSRFVREKTVLVVLHELSMTGAPISMLELATKIHVCGGRISAVSLNKQGGLWSEFSKRGIPVLLDKTVRSWTEADRADLVIVGSAACSSWIGQYLAHSPKGADRLAWWLMENRREYFDRAKPFLGLVRTLMFLSDLQSQLWKKWASEEGVRMPATVDIVPLSISDEVALAAGLLEQSRSTMADEKRKTLRTEVRELMGLKTSDVLVITLSSINPGKGQLLLLQSALPVAEDVETSSGALRSSKLRILIGSVGSKSNKHEYLNKIMNFMDQHPSLKRTVIWARVTTHVIPLYAAADVYVMNAQGIGETFGRVTIEAMAFGLPVLATDAGGTQEIVDANVTGLLHPVGRAGIPQLAQHLQLLRKQRDYGKRLGLKGREKVEKLYLEGLMYEKLAQIFRKSVS